MSRRLQVSVVDDDESVRESLPELLSVFGYAVEAFASAEECLASEDVRDSDCLIVDVAMPGMSGIELMRELRRQGCDIPIIFITAQSDIAAQIVPQEGVVACLYKPFSDVALLKALHAALRTS